MTKELSIKTIKEKLANALINDVRIIKLLPDNGKKKTSDYIGSNIFGHLNDADVTQCYKNKYIYYDVTEEQVGEPEWDNCFKVSISLKAHKDLLGNSATNCLDDISEYIKDIVYELFPYNRGYSNIPKTAEHNYAGRSIEFLLYEKSASRYKRNIEEGRIK